MECQAVRTLGAFFRCLRCPLSNSWASSIRFGPLNVPATPHVHACFTSNLRRWIGQRIPAEIRHARSCRSFNDTSTTHTYRTARKRVRCCDKGTFSTALRNELLLTFPITQYPLFWIFSSAPCLGKSWTFCWDYRHAKKSKERKECRRVLETFTRRHLRHHHLIRPNLQFWYAP